MNLVMDSEALELFQDWMMDEFLLTIGNGLIEAGAKGGTVLSEATRSVAIDVSCIISGGRSR